MLNEKQKNGMQEMDMGDLDQVSGGLVEVYGIDSETGQKELLEVWGQCSEYQGNGFCPHNDCKYRSNCLDPSFPDAMGSIDGIPYDGNHYMPQ